MISWFLDHHVRDFLTFFIRVSELPTLLKVFSSSFIQIFNFQSYFSVANLENLDLDIPIIELNSKEISELDSEIEQ